MRLARYFTLTIILVAFVVFVPVFNSGLPGTSGDTQASGYQQSPSVPSSTTGYLIALYTYPTDGTWAALISAAKEYPTVPIVAIINPDSGPGTSKDPNFVTGINDLRAAGITVLGYVWTCYGTRALTGSGTLQLSSCGTVGTPYSTGVENDIMLYHEWYNISGILYDEMNTALGGASYYSSATTYAHSFGYSTWGNPGTIVPSSYIGSADVINIYENSGLPSTSFLASATSSADRSNFSAVAYGVPSITQADISSMEPYVKWISVTDATMPNPYDALPSYLSTLLSYLATTETTSSTSSTTTSASTTMSTTLAPLTIDTAYQSGAPVSGLYTVIQSTNGSTLASGFSPLTYDATPGDTYVVTVDNYGSYYFTDWSTGATTSSIEFTPTQSTTLTAYYENNQTSTTTTTGTLSSTTLTAANTTTITSSTTSTLTSTSTVTTISTTTISKTISTSQTTSFTQTSSSVGSSTTPTSSTSRQSTSSTTSITTTTTPSSTSSRSKSNHGGSTSTQQTNSTFATSSSSTKSHERSKAVVGLSGFVPFLVSSSPSILNISIALIVGLAAGQLIIRMLAKRMEN